MTINLPRIKKNKIYFQTIFFLAIIGSLAITNELFCKYILGLGNPPLSITHPTIEYLFKPNQDIKRFGNRIIVNQYGMRSKNLSPQKASVDENRILIFGDSVVNGGNSTDHNDLATTLIQNKLETTQPNPIFVGNVSAGSWGPGNWLAYAQKFGFFAANTIVLVVSSHDYADNPSFQPLNPNTHPQKKPTLATIELLTRYLPKYLSKIKLNQAYADSSKAIKSDNAQPNQQSIKQGLSQLKAFLLMAKKTNADVYVVQYWNREEVETGKLQEGNKKINQVVKQLDIPVVQTGSLFQAAAKNGEEVFRDSIHPNDRGQELLSQVILSVLEQQ